MARPAIRHVAETFVTRKITRASAPASGRERFSRSAPSRSAATSAGLRLALDYLGHELEPSMLIGGWSTYFRVGGDISHDIDLIIASPEVRDRVRATVRGVSEPRHLQGRKWRGEVEGVHVDIYLPHESELGGKLRLKAEIPGVGLKAGVNV
jgi:hypothetical protein